MGQQLQSYIITWKKLLLDLSKRNRLINFTEGKRNNVRITSPSFKELFDLIVNEEKRLKFPFAKKVILNSEGEEEYSEVIKGTIETNKSITELQKTLKALRNKAKSSIEEQGVNILYLTFGMLKWKEQENSSQEFSSPILLVPVTLQIESINEPFTLVLHEDEIVLNPTLSQKLNNDFGIKLPDFEYDKEDIDIDEYIRQIYIKVENNGWHIEKSAYLTNLSFLKINMFKDLERNVEKLGSNNVIGAIVGEQESMSIPSDFSTEHDKNIKPIDTFQVVDADSSQQDAIQLSKRNVSFVLQGPPGTGKSQTITNIIAEAIADGKKVLFVSEKMAALQVVYNRLANVGLANFCLTLHSHKANKKEILQELDKSISATHTKVKDDILSELDILEKKRDELNDYQEELHSKTSGLNVSIYTINGRLAKLRNVPEVSFPISNVEGVTSSELNEKRALLHDLSNTILIKKEDFANNVWVGSDVMYSHDLCHKIDSKLTDAEPLLDKLNNLHQSICKRFDLEIFPSLNGNNILENILDKTSDAQRIYADWVLDNELDLLIKKAGEQKVKIDNIISATEKLKKIYKDEAFVVDAQKLKSNLCSSIAKLKSNVNSSNINTLASDIRNISENLKTIADKINSLIEQSRSLTASLRIPNVRSLIQILQLVKLSHALEQIASIKIPRKWLEKDNFERIRNDVKQHMKQHQDLIASKKVVLERFDKEIFDLDFYPILKRFRGGEYPAFIRFFKSGYRNDMKTLKSFMTNGGDLSYTEAFDLLNTLKTISDNKDEIESNNVCYEKNYGSYYCGLNTQWDKLILTMDSYASVANDLYKIDSYLKECVIDGQLPTETISNFNKLSSEIDVDYSEEYLRSHLKFDFSKNENWTDCDRFIGDINLVTESFISAYHELNNIRLSTCDYETAMSDLEMLLSFKTLEQEVKNDNDVMVNLYKDYYKGTDTDWADLHSALDHARDIKDTAKEYSLSKKFIEGVCENEEDIVYCKHAAEEIKQCKDILSQHVEWFSSMFDNGNSFYDFHILDLAKKMKLCKDKKEQLEEWCDYRSTRKKCEEAGLGEYINELEKLCIDSTFIADAYLKQFYRLWLDTTLPKFPAVQEFRRRNQDRNIKDFCRLDKLQFEIAKARVKERAFSRMPDFNSVNRPKDEIYILKREIEKKRKVMPLRKLFSLIPNLLTSLRPCFMMSPLSVSVFLEAKSYDFDMVIFDEASQVRTEDAVGAIMRGKQIIIAGDSKQLPPTNFFSSSMDEEDYDEELEVDSEAGNFESILDEADSVLPERTLRWHYRSRDESLIAFSNIKIYNKKLITFPSSVENSADLGVEYIHVNNGLYDRSGKRNNIIEAKKVADLVFDHFRKHPDRSLGVVTFSEAQQSAVDAAIRYKRRLEPRFERFFIEDKEEPFFIKNLENVQGDERDTIIFSIGYAKDNNGVMYMNFGPLSRVGGERRLNVAITRAKYNVKLVGSIMPNDIDLERTSSEGVKLLRSYIEFAQQGIKALEKELVFDDIVDCESPFEEAVYDFLQSKGYNVKTQIGCSGFRIDMAIKNPKDGSFAIGIECDGATYHSSKTARDRDRLRQEVLERMGWTIHRIWSTDWIKSPKAEEDKLVAAIEKAFGNTSIECESDEINEDANEAEQLTSPIDIEEQIAVSESQDDGYKFDYYQRALNCAKVINEYLCDYQILEIVKIEQPIHIEELYRRMAPLLDRQKVTTEVKRPVDHQIRLMSIKTIIKDKDGFIKLKDFNEVKVRIPNPADDYIRPIEYVCHQEIATVMKTLIGNSFGITSDDLFTETARIFGIKRTSEKTKNILMKSYFRMLEEHEIDEIDNKVRLM